MAFGSPDNPRPDPFLERFVRTIIVQASNDNPLVSSMRLTLSGYPEHR